MTEIGPLSADELAGIDAWWRAANYLAVGQIYLLDDPLLAGAAAAGAHQAAAARSLGHDPGPEPGLCACQPDSSGSVGSRRCSWPDRVTAGRPSRPAPGSRARTPRRTRTSPGTRRACSGCSDASRSRVAPAATSRPRCPVRSTRAASWATPCRTPTARASTTRSWWSSAWSATARPRPDRWPQLAVQPVRRPGPGRRRAAHPAPQRLQDLQPHGPRPDPARAAGGATSWATATSPLFVEGDDPALMHQQHGRGDGPGARHHRRHPGLARSGERRRRARRGR